MHLHECNNFNLTIINTLFIKKNQRLIYMRHYQLYKEKLLIKTNNILGFQ